jgi:polysaccharide export outer membrane protein
LGRKSLMKNVLVKLCQRFNPNQIFNALKATFILSIMCFSVASFSQSSAPSQQQIEQFKKLPRAQQEQLARQMGFDLSILKGANTTETAVNSAPVDTVERQVDETEVAEELSKQSVVESKSSELKPFGYELFNSERVSAEPQTNVPVPNDYIIGPGDSLKLQLYGKETGNYELIVNNEGNVAIPELGPLSIAGASYSEAKRLILQKYEQQKIGVEAFITMGQLKTIQVFLVGEVYRPGTLTLNSLSTVTTALFNSGGVSNIGSLRNIEIKRNGKTVTTFDLYDLIVYGNTENDIRLQQGDVIFVPTVAKIVSIEGEVRRPAIYELTSNESFDDLLTLAGGLMPNANKKSIQLVRNDIVKGLTILSLNSNDKNQRSAALTNGDFVSVPTANLEFTNAIRVLGAINSPQLVSLTQKQKLSAVVDRAAILNNTDLNYGLIVRRAKFDEHTSIIQFSPSAVINGNFDADLKALDHILLFNRVSLDSANELEKKITAGDLKAASDDAKSDEAKFVQKNELESFTTKQFADADTVNDSRKQLLAPIIARLKSEASEERSVQLIEVVGQVKFPGVYPIAANSSLANILRAAGGLTESAHLERAEITSTSYEDSAAVTAHKQFNLIAQLALDESEQIKFKSKDVLNIVRIPDWYEDNVVTLSGEVVFPGSYQISSGETLTNLLKRAGGLTRKATINAAVFTRVELQEREQESITQAIDNLRVQLANNNLSSSQFTKTIDYDNATKVLNDLEDTQPIGRLVIDLDELLNGKGLHDIELKDGDNLVIPNISPAISVIGEVFVKATHWYDPTLTIADYISKAGGVREYGDASKVYVVRANGSVFIPESNFWFSTANKVSLAPGDTIVVPRDVTNYDNIGLWQGVTQIVYQTAVALAAIGSL